MALGNVVIMGDGKCIEGTYNKVRIMGNGEVDGHIMCNKFSSAGSAGGNGSIQFCKCKTAGYFGFKGYLEGNELQIMGYGQVEGHVKVDTFRAYGMLNLMDTLQAETFILRGGIEQAQAIHCEQISIELLGRCNVKEIGGGEIRIGKTVKIVESGLKNKFLSSVKIKVGDENSRLEAEVIEGDTIYVDTAKIGVVRGKHIEIGPECEIDKIEYSESLKIHESAKIGQQIQITTRRDR